MAKYYGKIGYGISEETAPGIYKVQIVERDSYGDIMRHTKQYRASDKVNDDVTINMELSILQDPFVIENFHLIKYAEFGGVKWKVTSVEPRFPRLILSLGEVYNGDE